MAHKNTLEIRGIEIPVELNSTLRGEERTRRYHQWNGEEHDEIVNVPRCRICGRDLDPSEIMREVEGLREVDPDAIKEGIRGEPVFRAVGLVLSSTRIDPSRYKDHYVVSVDEGFPWSVEALDAVSAALLALRQPLVCTLILRRNDPARRVLLYPTDGILVARRLVYSWEYRGLGKPGTERTKKLRESTAGRKRIKTIRRYLDNVHTLPDAAALDDPGPHEIVPISREPVRA